ncbi:MAG: hypothetical protein R3300_16970 [Candidatus Promineifilaceae bacterium]|nr:hypothetical protein [Candidatus Promineifilaceae bacterium]
MSHTRRRLEINGGRVFLDDPWRLELPAGRRGYADAQVDDYGGLARKDYPWTPGTNLSLRARFSHESGTLQGTAGFGFWNAPFGDPTIRIPALPKAAWFFYASAPNDLPFPISGAGRGWFAGTLDAATPRALALVPLAPLVITLNNASAVRRRLWPWLRQQLAISYAPMSVDMRKWHWYQLAWGPEEVRFLVDGDVVLTTRPAPGGALGFVAWLDNQYLVARPTGRLRWGTLSTAETQWLEVKDVRLQSLAGV